MKLRISLAQKLTLFYVAFAALILVLVGSLSWYSGRSVVQAATTSNLVLTAAQDESTTVTWFSDRQKDIASLTDSDSFQKDFIDFVAATPGTATAKAMHQRLVSQFTPKTGATHQFSLISVMDPASGQVIIASDPAEEGKSRRDQDYFINGKTAPYIVGPYYSDKFQAQAIIVSGPMVSADGQLLGVLAASLNLDRMDAVIFDRSSIHQTDDAYLVNNSGLFVTQPRFTPSPEIEQNGEHTEAVQQCLTSKNSGVLSVNDYRGVPVIVAYQWITDRQMCLLVKEDQSEIFAPLATFQQTLLLFSGLALMVAFALAIALSRTITRPILALQTGAMRFGQGELNLRLSETSRDELGALAREFNTMADAISQKEAQLVQSASEYQTLMDSVPDNIYFKDTNSRFTRMNQAQARMLGAADPKEALGKTDFDYQSSKLSQEFFVEEQELLKTGQPILNRIEFNPTSDGADRWFSASKVPIKDTEGRIIGLVGISRNVTDITERKLSEDVVIQSLARLTREQEARADAEAATGRLTFLLETSGLVAESFDYEARLQQFAHQIVPRIADWCAIEVMGEDRKLKRVAVVHIDPAKVQLAFDIAQRFPTDPDSPTGSYQVLRSGESELASEIPDELLAASITNPELLALTRQLGFKSAMSVPLMAHGVALGVITLVMAESDRRFNTDDLVFVEELARRVGTLIENAQLHDETQRLNADLEQRVVERTAQLEAVNKELEAFSYSVSHDLRTPLRAIDGFSRILVRDYGPLLPPDAQRRLETVREGAQQMGQLIDDLLTFSRLSRQPIAKQPLTPTDLARQALQGLNTELENRDVQVTISDLPPCEADPALLKLVFINLISNALKFTRGCKAARIEVGSQEIEGIQTYFVKDNGAGFDMQYYDKLFGVFQRLHRAEDFEGTGVGLAIVQRIIRRHGGRVWGEGQVDQGATFYFTLGGEETT